MDFECNLNANKTKPRKKKKNLICDVERDSPGMMLVYDTLDSL